MGKNFVKISLNTSIIHSSLNVSLNALSLPVKKPIPAEMIAKAANVLPALPVTILITLHKTLVKALSSADADVLLVWVCAFATIGKENIIDIAKNIAEIFLINEKQDIKVLSQSKSIEKEKPIIIKEFINEKPPLVTNIEVIPIKETELITIDQEVIETDSNTDDGNLTKYKI